MENNFNMEFLSLSENEAFARMVCAAFVSGLDPTVTEVCELKTAVSEAVTNAIVHAYPDKNGYVILKGMIKGSDVYITVADNGIGIEDVQKAREPLYTAKPEQERSGLGFSIMESFCDEVTVTSRPGCGTTVTLMKKITSCNLKE